MFYSTLRPFCNFNSKCVLQYSYCALWEVVVDGKIVSGSLTYYGVPCKRLYLLHPWWECWAPKEYGNILYFRDSTNFVLKLYSSQLLPVIYCNSEYSTNTAFLERQKTLDHSLTYVDACLVRGYICCTHSWEYQFTWYSMW